jgi:hypothetical protein
MQNSDARQLIANDSANHCQPADILTQYANNGHPIADTDSDISIITLKRLDVSGLTINMHLLESLKLLWLLLSLISLLFRLLS